MKRVWKIMLIILVIFISYFLISYFKNLKMANEDNFVRNGIENPYCNYNGDRYEKGEILKEDFICGDGYIFKKPYKAENIGISQPLAKMCECSGEYYIESTSGFFIKPKLYYCMGELTNCECISGTTFEYMSC